MKTILNNKIKFINIKLKKGENLPLEDRKLITSGLALSFEKKRTDSFKTNVISRVLIQIS